MSDDRRQDIKVTADLSAEKKELLRRRLEGLAPRGPKGSIPRRAPSAPTPASFAQEQLWFFDQLSPESTAYNIYCTLRLTGSLDVAILTRSLNEVVHRHESLRTTFASVAGVPSQVVAPAVEERDLVLIVDQALPGVDAEEEIARAAHDEAERVFDLAKGPLIRARLLRIAAEDHVLFLTAHHIAADGWSLSIFVRELAAFYEAGVRRVPAALPPLPIQYSDYAIWQREQLSGAALERQLDYWRNELQDAPNVIDLPTDTPRPKVQSFRGARHTLAIPEKVNEAIGALCRREGVTLYMAVLAAFQLLLSRYSGQDDVVIGGPVANRMRMETEKLIGLFINTVPLRGRMSGSLRVKELLQKTKETTPSFRFGHARRA